TFGTAQFESVFTYQGVSRPLGMARFTISANAELRDQPENALEKPLVLKSQSQKGSIDFDNANGYLRSIRTTQEMATEKPFREMTIETKSILESQVTIEKQIENQ
ncbi:MAG: hypothetical protein VX438_00845, partial [Planctomycetota bacterium]|nr:hypothetical protein [Planctomycetota bacterium]